MSLKPYRIVAIAKTNSGSLNIVPFASVEVKDSSNVSYVTIYGASTGAGSEITQPTTVDSNGELDIWIEDGTQYTVTVGGSDVVPIFIPSDAGTTSASTVSVTDSGTYFAGSDVEAVLQEIGADLASYTNPVWVDGITGYIETVSDGDIKVAIQIPFAGTINTVTTQSVSGTCTATFKINSTALGGTANSVSSTEQDQAHASANVFSAGDNIVLTVSSNSTCLGFSFMIKFTRTLT